MAAGVITNMASTLSEWADAWRGTDPLFRGELTRHSLDDALVWNGIIRRGEPDPRDRLLTVYTALGLHNTSPSELSDRLDAGLALHAAAVGAASDWGRQLAGLSDLQYNLDAGQAPKRARLDREEVALKRLQSPAAQLLPAVWRGKAYRRAELAGDEKGRERAEDAAREKWARKLVELLTEARLPFGLEILERELDPLGVEASRCLRGARWTSLKKRCSDWAPARRYLLAHFGLPFPPSPRELLGYLETKQREGAARTSFDATLGALRFLEEAGEVTTANLLHKDPALLNAAKESAT